MFDVDNDKMRILHFLNRPLKEIKKEIPLIKEQGFDAVQISPVQPFKDQERENPGWYMVYQPFGFKIGNKYGSKEDLIGLCNIANEYGIRIIVDVVCNHMANKSDSEPLIPHENVDPLLKDNPYFWKEPKMVEDWNNRTEVTQYCMGMPGLEASNYDLQNIILKFLKEIAECGAGGFRFDAAKSIALPYPDDILYNYSDCHFWKRVVKEGLAEYDLFNYGEVIFVENNLIKSYANYLNVLTNRSVEEIPETVSMAENHDSYLNIDEMGWSRNKPIEEVLELYNTLTKGWNKTVFFNRPATEMWKLPEVKEYNEQKYARLVKVKTR